MFKVLHARVDEKKQEAQLVRLAGEGDAPLCAPKHLQGCLAQGSYEALQTQTVTLTAALSAWPERRRKEKKKEKGRKGEGLKEWGECNESKVRVLWEAAVTGKGKWCLLHTSTTTHPPVGVPTPRG